MRIIYNIFFSAGISLLFSCIYTGNEQEPGSAVNTDTGFIADSGMVVSAHTEASKAGLDILKKGGNAVDAAVAVQFALAAVYPNAGNIGGGGFMVLRMNTGETHSLDFREKAPAKASSDMFLDKDGNVIEDRSSTGFLSAGVPGSVDGMFRAHAKYGKLPWKDLLEPAIALAEKGFPVTEKQAEELNSYQVDFLKWNDSLSLPPFVKKDRSDWKAGDVLIQKELAQTLKRIWDKGRDGFYSGKTAEDIVRAMNGGGGIITHEDLKNYSSVWRMPVSGYYKQYKVISLPPPSSGGIALVQLLNMMENYPLKDFGMNKEKAVHLMAEAEKRVYADRSVHLGDPDFYPVPVKQLLDSMYIISRMEDFNAGSVTDCRKISAGSFTASPLPGFAGCGEKAGVWTEKEETTHFSIVDRWRNAVAVTTTLNGSYGSFISVPGSGFLMNNEMDDFSIKPGTPNSYGLVGAEANAIAPGKRMLSSMTPAILEKDGKLFMAVGTPGGSTIITSVFQAILNVIEHGMTMNEAVNAKKFHCQWKPDTLFMEKGALDSSTVSALLKKRHHVVERRPIGRTDAILVLPNGKLEGGADKRGDDKAEGY